jgi:hypothetical protein
MSCIAICGLTKQSGPFLDSALQNIRNIVTLFDNYTVIIVESNSTDNTKEKLKAWAQADSKFEIINHDFKNPTEMSREVKISTCRNLYLKKLYSKKQAYTYVMMIDMDTVFSRPFDVSGLKKALECSGWNALFANQSYRYYDIWALRAATINYDCWEMIHKNTKMTNAKQVFIHNHQIHIPKTHSLIPVTSAFGGMGIYRGSALLETKPMYEIKAGVCEHIEFNKKLKHLFICPSLVLESPTENNDYKCYFK